MKLSPTSFQSQMSWGLFFQCRSLVTGVPGVGSEPLASPCLWYSSRMWLVLPGLWFPAIFPALLSFFPHGLFSSVNCGRSVPAVSGHVQRWLHICSCYLVCLWDKASPGSSPLSFSLNTLCSVSFD